jgi:hypothetical protein
MEQPTAHDFFDRIEDLLDQAQAKLPQADRDKLLDRLHAEIESRLIGGFADDEPDDTDLGGEA